MKRAYGVSWRDHPKGSSHKAFTLTEILLVLVVGSIILTLLFPTVNTLVSQSQRSTCMANLRSIGIALQAYAADNNGELPNRSGQQTHNAPLTISSALVGINGAAGYLEWNPAGGTRWSDKMLCPADPNQQLWKTSLGYPRSYIYRQTDFAPTSDNRPMKLLIKREEQENVARRWLVVDRYGAPGGGRILYPGTEEKVPQSGLPGLDNLTISSFWHKGGANVLYEDGSVSWKRHGEVLGE